MGKLGSWRHDRDFIYSRTTNTGAGAHLCFRQRDYLVYADRSPRSIWLNDRQAEAIHSTTYMQRAPIKARCIAQFTDDGQHSLGNDAMLQDGSGQRLSSGALRTRFDTARKAAKVSFQFRDIHAKTATDTENLAHAQRLLGHKTRGMTEHYTRNRKGDKVNPLK
jgi:integrase